LFALKWTGDDPIIGVRIQHLGIGFGIQGLGPKERGPGVIGFRETFL
jgi:hypothetical protein